MMDKVDVNGVGAHPVYYYLKKVAGPVSIDKMLFPRAHVMSITRSLFSHPTTYGSMNGND